MGFVSISNLPCLNLAFVQDSAPFLTTYAPNVTFGLGLGLAAAHPSDKKTLHQPSRNKLKQEFPLTKLCHFSLTSLLSCTPNKVTECSFHPYPVGKVNSLRFTFRTCISERHRE